MKLINSIFNVLRFNRRNWKAVVLCIFAATVFWFLNALNKTYTTNLRFPLTFDYDKETYVPVSALPKDVRINVTGDGWDLFRRSTGVKIPPLEIPLERPAETKKIVGSTLPAFFTNQLEGLEINYVLTDTIYVDLEPKTGRWVKLAVDPAKLRLKKDYGLASQVTIMPDSIYLEGPRPIINQIEEPVNVTLPVEEIDDNVMEDVEVTLPSQEFIKRNPPTVAVMIDVEPMVTVRDSISLVIRNLPSDVWPVMGRKEIPVVFAIPRNMMGHYIPDSAQAILDLKNIGRGERRLLPKVQGLPQFSRVVSIDSVSIKF
jgi:hypothetical protein